MHEEVWIQVVAPNRVRRETFLILLISFVVVIISAIIIHFNQREQPDAKILSQFEISSRYDLTPAEQGIYTDLLLIYEDWLLQNPSAPNPEIDSLIADNWPPFTDTVEQKKRGDHQWTKIHIDKHDAYLGITHDKNIAKNFLWILPSNRENASLDDFTVWLSVNAPSMDIAPSLENIPEAGWRRIRNI